MIAVSLLLLLVFCLAIPNVHLGSKRSPRRYQIALLISAFVMSVAMTFLAAGLLVAALMHGLDFTDKAMWGSLSLVNSTGLWLLTIAGSLVGAYLNCHALLSCFRFYLNMKTAHPKSNKTAAAR